MSDSCGFRMWVSAQYGRGEARDLDEFLGYRLEQ
jgi:hypothetical protein